MTGMSANDMATAAQALAAAVAAAAQNPADAIRLLSAMITTDSLPPAAADPIGLAVTDTAAACADLFRRTAVIALARAATTYQPASYDDALTIRDRVAALLEAEITIAGDAGEDDAYNALRSLRIAVIADLNARGADLAPIADFAPGQPRPSLALAVSLYRDAGRADELTLQANPVHPAFMPPAFKALAR